MRLGHVALLVRDPDAMLEFYVGKLGLRVSDRGFTRGAAEGSPIIFLSFDPRAVHHQLALIGTAEPLPPSGRAHHIALEAADLTAIRKCWASVANDLDLGGLDASRPTAVFQGDQWSIRLCDPEGNGIEIYALTPWDVQQPFFRSMDLSLSDDELLAWAEEQLSGHAHWPRGTRPTYPY